MYRGASIEGILPQATASHVAHTCGAAKLAYCLFLLLNTRDSLGTNGYLFPSAFLVCVLHPPVQELRQLLQQQSSASSAALDAERAAAAQQADESAAAAAESAQEAAAAALHAAEVRAALLEGQLEVTEQERDALLKQVGWCPSIWGSWRGGLTGVFECKSVIWCNGRMRRGKGSLSTTDHLQPLHGLRCALYLMHLQLLLSGSSAGRLATP